MARCPNCNKFVPLELQEPEVDDLSWDGESITGSVRIVRNCEECGTEMKEATFDIDERADFCKEDDDHEVTVESALDSTEEGGGRYKKSYFGAEGILGLKCTCGKAAEVKWSDKIDAGSMDELV